jgi:hypothetical protein
MGLFGVLFFLVRKRDTSLKNGTSGHPDLEVYFGVDM